MPTTQDRLVYAYRYGHHYNPDFPSLANLDRGRLAAMDGSERDAKDLITSWQSFDAAVDTIAASWGQKTLEREQVGPVSAFVQDGVRRCGMMDFAPPEGAVIDFGDSALDRAAESYRLWKAEKRVAEATGTGSWPVPGCDPDAPSGVHSIRVRINPSGAPAGVAAYMTTALVSVVKAYAEIGLLVRYIIGASGDCEIAKIFSSLRGSTIGMNEFPRPNTCQQTIKGWLDTGYSPKERVWAGLELHETGHGVGEEHTRGGPMNPSILDLPVTWIGTPSYASLARSFGGQPIIIPGGPDTPTPGTEPFVYFELDEESQTMILRARKDFTAKAGDSIEVFTLPAPRRRF